MPHQRNTKQNERGLHRQLTRPHFQMDSFAGLQVVDDLKEVVRTRVALRPEHAHKAFGRYVGSLRQLPKTDSRVDIVPQNRFACRHIASKHSVYALFEHGLPEIGIPLGAI